MRKKTIVMLLVVSMVLSMFAGCSTANPVVDSTETGENAVVKA